MSLSILRPNQLHISKRPDQSLEEVAPDFVKTSCEVIRGLLPKCLPTYAPYCLEQYCTSYSTCNRFHLLFVSFIEHDFSIPIFISNIQPGPYLPMVF